MYTLYCKKRRVFRETLLVMFRASTCYLQFPRKNPTYHLVFASSRSEPCHETRPAGLSPKTLKLHVYHPESQDRQHHEQLICRCHTSAFARVQGCLPQAEQSLNPKEPLSNSTVFSGLGRHKCFRFLVTRSPLLIYFWLAKN